MFQQQQKQHPVTSGPSDIDKLTFGPIVIDKLTFGPTDIDKLTSGPNDIDKLTFGPTDNGKLTFGPTDWQTHLWPKWHWQIDLWPKWHWQKHWPLAPAGLVPQWRPELAAWELCAEICDVHGGFQNCKPNKKYSWLIVSFSILISLSLSTFLISLSLFLQLFKFTITKIYYTMRRATSILLCVITLCNRELLF